MLLDLVDVLSGSSFRLMALTYLVMAGSDYGQGSLCTDSSYAPVALISGIEMLLSLIP